MAAQGGGIVSALGAIERPVVFESEGQHVVGMFHRPQTTTACPAVLMLHGFTGSKHEIRRLFVQQARALARVGIATLRFDFRGCGDSAGEFHEMTVSGMCRDAASAWHWLARQDGIAAERMGVLGMSLGGMIAALAVDAGLPARSAVFWSPVTNPRRLVANRSSADTHRQMASSGVADMNGWAVGLAFVQEMMTADPLAAMKRITSPLHFLHGDQDPTVPHEDTVTAVAALQAAGREVSFTTLPGADHGFSSLPIIERLLSETAAAFRTRL